MTRLLPIAAAAATLMATAVVPATAQARGYSNAPVTVYFTRHARKETQTTETGGATQAYDVVYNDGVPTITPMNGATVGANLTEACGDDKCAEILSDRGEQYADLLAGFFERRGIRFDAVYSSHKERTRQTVAPTAMWQGLGDVIQLPADGTELNPQGTSVSECLTLDVINNAAPGSTLLIAGHSGTLYDIMGDGNSDCDGLGLLSDDDASSDQFPKDSKGKVANFNDLWKVKIRNGNARLAYRINLQPTQLRVVDRAGRESRNMH